MNKKFYLVCSDICSDSRRRRVVKLMEEHGHRVQKSVFECWLSQNEFESFKKKIEKIVTDRTDSVRYYPICKKCVRELTVSGIPLFTSYEELVVY